MDHRSGQPSNNPSERQCAVQLFTVRNIYHCIFSNPANVSEQSRGVLEAGLMLALDTATGVPSVSTANASIKSLIVEQS